jgi:hypothetical protein
MARLSSTTLIDLWDRGLDAPPVERAIDLLAGGLGRDPDQLERLSIGRRDQLLLDLRALIVGERVDAVTNCPSCGDAAEVGFGLDDVRVRSPEEGAATTEAGGYLVTWRLPASADLREIGDREIGGAREQLLDRCVLGARREGEPVERVPRDVLARVVEDMGRADPGAELQLGLECPSCGHAWWALFDPAEFLWIEIDACARGLLEEVGTLAAAYGWSERDILGMGASRRERYLELVHQ